MTADEARARLEAAIWDTPPYGKLTAADVDRILAAADFYAEQYADEVLARLEAEYAGPARLAAAAAELYGKEQ